MKKFSFLLFHFLFFTTISHSQNYCGDKPKPDIFDNIFGTDSLFYGVKTIYFHKSEFVIKSKIVYSCDQCSLTCISGKGKKLWTRDLTDQNCKIIMLEHYGWRAKDRIKGCDVVFQLKNKTVYGLKSRNGKIKKLNNYQQPPNPEKTRSAKNIK